MHQSTVSQDNTRSFRADRVTRLLDPVNHNEARRKRFESVKGLFSDVFSSAEIRTVDPMNCVSLSEPRIRPICRTGVNEFKDALRGCPSAEATIQGFVSTGRFSLITDIPDGYQHLLVKNFIESGKSEQELRELSSNGPWYHVVDGGHLHLSIVELMEEISESYGGFQWPVVIIAWQPIETLKAIALACQEMQKECHTIDFPLPDLLFNLREVVDSYCAKYGIALKKGEKPRHGFIKKVVDQYIGGPSYDGQAATTTSRALCSIVVKLSQRMVAEIRNLLTEECEEYRKLLGSDAPYAHDARIYKRLFSTQSLKGSKHFLDHSNVSDEDRIQVIHRLRYLARERGSFKPFRTEEIDYQTLKAVAARKEIEKFVLFLSDEPWPRGMNSLRRNVLSTTLVDDASESNMANADQLLSLIVESYINAAGTRGRQRIDMFELLKAREANIRAEQDPNGPSDGQTPAEEDVPSPNDETATVATSMHGQQTFRPDLPGRQEDPDIISYKEDNETNGLEQCQVEVHSVTFEQYETNADGTASSFDFLISEPFQKVLGEQLRHMDEKEIKSFAQFIRRVLVPGAYAFIFLEWSKLSQWSSVFAVCNFNVSSDPFLGVKDCRKFQRMRLNGLQSVHEPAMVVQKPGKHPRGFSIDKKTAFLSLTSCTMQRWSNEIDGVTPPSQRLTLAPSRNHVRPNEKNISLFIEIFQTFCPQGANS